MNEARTGFPASRKVATQVSYFGKGFLGNPVVSGNTGRMQAMRQIGQLQRLCEGGQANKATRIMVEMSKTTQGREQLLNIHRMASKMIPHAQTNKAASTWTSIQQVSGALKNGAN